jgi:hypothetical protein
MLVPAAILVVPAVHRPHPVRRPHRESSPEQRESGASAAILVPATGPCRRRPSTSLLLLLLSTLSKPKVRQLALSLLPLLLKSISWRHVFFLVLWILYVTLVCS